VSEQGEDPQQQLIAALATTSRRAQDAEDELEASAAMLAVARRRIAQLEAEVASLRRAFADKIADRVLSELARYAAEPQLTVRVFPGVGGRRRLDRRRRPRERAARGHRRPR
jgi:septal ring factor EnvC (AmiA/AmiB activator)